MQSQKREVRRTYLFIAVWLLSEFPDVRWPFHGREALAHCRARDSVRRRGRAGRAPAHRSLIEKPKDGRGEPTGPAGSGRPYTRSAARRRLWQRHTASAPPTAAAAAGRPAMLLPFPAFLRLPRFPRSPAGAAAG